MSARGVLRIVEGGGLSFFCPGCKERHTIYHGPGDGPRWGFNGDYVLPTFSPSVFIRSGHYVTAWAPGMNCWCTYNAANPDRPSRSRCVRCHSFVRNGQIEFLTDSTHELAGKTVPLEPFE